MRAEPASGLPAESHSEAETALGVENQRVALEALAVLLNEEIAVRVQVGVHLDQAQLGQSAVPHLHRHVVGDDLHELGEVLWPTSR